MGWYQQHYGFRSPCHVLVAADFLIRCVEKNKDAVQLVQALLGEPAIIETTNCTVAALQRSQSPFAPRAAAIAFELPLTFQCQHQHIKREGTAKVPVFKTSSACISKIMENPKNKLVVATQDFVLWKRLRKLGRVPLITANEHAQLSLAAHKRKHLPSRTTKTTSVDEKEQEMVRDGWADVKAQRKEAKERKMEQLLPFKRQHKKKRAKGANPMSTKKKKQRSAAFQEDSLQPHPLLPKGELSLATASTATPSTPRERPRKRVRKGKKKRLAIAAATTSSETPSTTEGILTPAPSSV